MPLEDPQYHIRFVSPDPELYHLYYNEISNSLLWFMQHSMWDISREPVIDEQTYHAWSHGYRKVNQLFAREILREIRSTDRKPLVFLQDYHLYLCAAYVRRKAPGALIHHFTHTPWMQSDYFLLLPAHMRRELLQGLLSCDVVGFHTPRYAANFLQCCQEGDTLRVSINQKRRSIGFGDREVLVRHYPISVDHHALERTALRSDVNFHRERIRSMLGDRKLVVRVDRIEPSKNILRGLEAFGALLRSFADWRERVIFAVFLYPSRGGLKKYRDYQHDVEEAARRINQEFGGPGWQPVHLEISDDYPRSVAALMEFDALMVNPVSDGMNLVAKEGAVLNSRDGIILLSVRAGAYVEMKGAVLALNPLDIRDTARQLNAALSMPASKRRVTAARAREKVRENTSFKWLLGQIHNLRRVEKARHEEELLESNHFKLPGWVRQI